MFKLEMRLNVPIASLSKNKWDTCCGPSEVMVTVKSADCSSFQSADRLVSSCEERMVRLRTLWPRNWVGVSGSPSDGWCVMSIFNVKIFSLHTPFHALDLSLLKILCCLELVQDMKTKGFGKIDIRLDRPFGNVPNYDPDGIFTDANFVIYELQFE